MRTQRRDEVVVRDFRRNAGHEDVRGFGKSRFQRKVDGPEVNTPKPDRGGRLLVNHLEQEAALVFLLHSFDLLEPNASNELRLDLCPCGRLGRTFRDTQHKAVLVPGLEQVDER